MNNITGSFLRTPHPNVLSCSDLSERTVLYCDTVAGDYAQVPRSCKSLVSETWTYHSQRVRQHRQTVRNKRHRLPVTVSEVVCSLCQSKSIPPMSVNQTYTQKKVVREIRTYSLIRHRPDASYAILSFRRSIQLNDRVKPSRSVVDP